MKINGKKSVKPCDRFINDENQQGFRFWNAHIDNITAKRNRTFGLVKRTCKLRDHVLKNSTPTPTPGSTIFYTKEFSVKNIVNPPNLRFK